LMQTTSHNALRNYTRRQAVPVLQERFSFL
jgi:hypothetical protein